MCNSSQYKMVLSDLRTNIWVLLVSLTFCPKIIQEGFYRIIKNVVLSLHKKVSFSNHTNIFPLNSDTKVTALSCGLLDEDMLYRQ